MTDIEPVMLYDEAAGRAAILKNDGTAVVIEGAGKNRLSLGEVVDAAHRLMDVQILMLTSVSPGQDPLTGFEQTLIGEGWTGIPACSDTIFTNQRSPWDIHIPRASTNISEIRFVKVP